MTKKSSFNLIQFGFDEKTEAIYLALLELGETTVSALVKKSGIKRTTVYAALQELHAKGLLSLSKRKKRTLYIAEDPRLLLKQFEERKQKLEEAIPLLLSLHNALPKKPTIRYYEGVEGIKQAYRDTLLYPDQEMLAWVSSEALHSFDSDFLYEDYLPKRLERKIWVRAIAPDTPEMKKYQLEDQISLRQTRIISQEDFPFDVEIDLYGKRKIAIMSFEEQFAMIIESERLWKSMKSMFEMGWLFAQVEE